MRYWVYIFSFFTLSYSCVAQVEGEVNLQLSKFKFAELVDSMSARIEDGDTIFTVEESILLVRISNTIYFNAEMRYLHGEFLQLFHQSFTAFRCAKTLNMIGLSFGTFYSEEYDLFIAYKDHQNSRFKIIESE